MVVETSIVLYKQKVEKYIADRSKNKRISQI